MKEVDTLPASEDKKGACGRHVHSKHVNITQHGNYTVFRVQVKKKNCPGNAICGCHDNSFHFINIHKYQKIRFKKCKAELSGLLGTSLEDPEVYEKEETW